MTALIATWRKRGDDREAQAVRFGEVGLPHASEAQYRNAKLARSYADELETAIATPDPVPLAAEPRTDGWCLRPMEKLGCGCIIDSLEKVTPCLRHKPAPPQEPT